MDGSRRINSIFGYYQEKDGSYQPVDLSLARYVGQDICGCFIDGVNTIDFDGFITWIDEMFPEGIEIELPDTIHDEAYPTANYGVKTIHYEAGVHRLSGEQLLEVMRSRHSSSDSGRQGMQQRGAIAIVTNLISGIQNDYLRALTFKDVTVRLFGRFETNAQAQIPDAEGHMYSFGGLSLNRLLAHIENTLGSLGDSSRIGSLIQAINNPQARELFRNWKNYATSGIVNMVQLTADYTERGQDPMNKRYDTSYWGKARKWLTGLIYGQEFADTFTPVSGNIAAPGGESSAATISSPTEQPTQIALENNVQVEAATEPTTPPVETTQAAVSGQPIEIVSPEKSPTVSVEWSVQDPDFLTWARSETGPFKDLPNRSEMGGELLFFVLYYLNNNEAGKTFKQGEVYQGSVQDFYDAVNLWATVFEGTLGNPQSYDTLTAAQRELLLLRTQGANPEAIKNFIQKHSITIRTYFSPGGVVASR
jgi:hypothetical protein